MADNSRGTSLEELIEELARVIWEPDRARTVLLNAGFPRQDLPEFKTARVFWTLVIRVLHEGEVPGGVRRVVDQAMKEFPASQIFATFPHNEVFPGWRSPSEAASRVADVGQLPSATSKPVPASPPRSVGSPSNDGAVGGGVASPARAGPESSFRRPTPQPAGNFNDNRGATIAQQINVAGNATIGDALRTWRGRITIALVIGAMLLAVTLVLSREARRTACKVPGVRTVCEAVGIGDIPSEHERTLWEAAFAETSGEGLRGYLQAYPDGAYAERAQILLATCRFEREEVMGPERKTRYVMRISSVPNDPFGTEDEARRDARARGDREAAITCVPAPAAAATSLVSAVAEPDTWHCSPRNGGFACGFDGVAVCRVRPRRSIQREVCQLGAPETEEP